MGRGNGKQNNRASLDELMTIRLPRGDAQQGFSETQEDGATVKRWINSDGELGRPFGFSLLITRPNKEIKAWTQNGKISRDIEDGPAVEIIDKNARSVTRIWAKDGEVVRGGGEMMPSAVITNIDGTGELANLDAELTPERLEAELASLQYIDCEASGEPSIIKLKDREFSEALWASSEGDEYRSEQSSLNGITLPSAVVFGPEGDAVELRFYVGGRPPKSALNSTDFHPTKVAVVSEEAGGNYGDALHFMWETPAGAVGSDLIIDGTEVVRHSFDERVTDVEVIALGGGERRIQMTVDGKPKKFRINQIIMHSIIVSCKDWDVGAIQDRLPLWFDESEEALNGAG